MKIEFLGSIGDSTSAIKRSGKLSGGGTVTFDVPEAYIGTLAALMPLVLLPLRITLEVAEGEILGASEPQRRPSKRRVEAPPEQPIEKLALDEEEANARRLLEQVKAQQSGRSTPPRPNWEP